MKELELQFPIEDVSRHSDVLLANEEKQENAEEEHVENEAAANGWMPRGDQQSETLDKPDES